MKFESEDLSIFDLDTYLLENTLIYFALKVTVGAKPLDFTYYHPSHEPVLPIKPVKNQFEYRTRPIITRGSYIFYPILEGQKRFFKELFSSESP